MAPKLLLLSFIIFFCYVNGSPAQWMDIADEALDSFKNGTGEVIASLFHKGHKKSSRKNIKHRKNMGSGSEDVGNTGTPTTMDYSGSGSEDVDVTGTPTEIHYTGSRLEDVDVTSTPTEIYYTGSGSEDVGITGTPTTMDYSGSRSEDVDVTGTLTEIYHTGSGSEDVDVTGNPTAMDYSGSGSEDVDVTGTPTETYYTGSGSEDVGTTGTPTTMDYSGSGSEDVDVTGTPTETYYTGSGSEDVGTTGTPTTMDYSGSGSEDVDVSGTPTETYYTGRGSEDVDLTGTPTETYYTGSGSEDVGTTGTPTTMDYSGSGSEDVDVTGTPTETYYTGSGSEDPTVIDYSGSGSTDSGITNTLDTIAYSTSYSEENTVTNTLGHDEIVVSTTTPYPFSESEYVTVTEVQEILSEMETNKLIERKIIEAMNEFSSNCNIYNPIKLSVKDFRPPSLHRLRLDNADAIFTNLRVWESDNEDQEWKNYSTTIGCDSSNTIKVQVSIPPKITIAADIHIINSLDEVIKKGTISLTTKGVNIMKQYIVKDEANGIMEEMQSSNNSTPALAFEKSEVALSIDTLYQIPIYQRLNAFLDELKPLQEYYANQLKVLMKKNDISLGKSCSKIFHMEEARTPLDSWNGTSLKELYIIPDVKFNTWKGKSLSAGPILIDGLLNFKRSEFVVIKPEPRHNILFHLPPQNEVIKRIRTENLRGKFEWEYRLKKNVLPFTIDYVDFESIFRKIGGHPSILPHNIEKSINVAVGTVEVHGSQSRACENENHFANFILSGYLQSLIEDSLKNSIQNKLIRDLSLKKCSNF
ncbi:uncharacterized protein LOC135842020 isoform X2 [Planococcus citri]|uniref:uncharacterized protein LOC135842020 isoform X2 n=1 Tax=Planococcus citri TaxID=170843 RepID=UPI0031F77B8B